MLNDILLRTKGTELYIFYPVIRLRISFVNVITTPPARVRNPFKILTPFGAEVIINTNIADGYIVALDKNYAIERVVASDITTEFDKLIDRQLERASISTIVGFNCIFPNAIRVFCKQV